MEPAEMPSAKIFRESKVFFFLLALFGGIVGSALWENRGVFFSHQEGDQKSHEVTAASAVAIEDKTLTQLVNENSPGVVSIVVKKSFTQMQTGFPFFFVKPAPQNTPSSPQTIGSGSGFFATKDGIIVTNKHVVADEGAEYFIHRSGDETEYKATVIARDPVNDIAFLKIEGQDFPALTLGDSDALQVGESAIAIGNSLGEFANSVSRGIISGKQRSLTAGNQYGEVETLSGIIQTDAAINPGNSGGPLFNLRGEVIGVNVAVAQGAENIGFALPINQIKIRLEQVQKTGEIKVPYIGLRYVLVNEAVQKELKLPYSYGVLVLRGRELTDFAVIPDSPAAKAGIAEGDVLLTLDGQKITNEGSVSEIIAKHEIGDTVSVTIWRKGEEKKLSLVLEERR